jgi:two-component system response regulator RpfG
VSLEHSRKARDLVVVVDDQDTGRTILAQLIRSIDNTVEVVAFGDSREALGFVRERTPDLILTDYKMPGLDGLAFTREVRGIPACRDVPLVMVTIVEDKRIRYEALDAGATDFLNRPIDPHECRARCRNLLTLRHQQQIIRHRARWLEEQVALATQEIGSRERETLLRLAKAGEYRDEGTGNHVVRIARYCRVIAEGLGLPSGRCEEIELASPMHDIGKIGIPDSVLLKIGPLTPGETTLMRTHTRIGYEILKGSPSRYLQLGAIIALHHHEKFDGSGYPNRLSGDDIPLSARIVAVADVFDALTTERPYKRSWSADQAVRHIEAGVGRHFDPACVAAFRNGLERIEDIHSTLLDPLAHSSSAEGG